MSNSPERMPWPPQLCRQASRLPRAWRTIACAALAVSLAGLSVSFGQPHNSRVKVAPGAKSPPPSTLVELLVPAGEKVALEGTKITHNSKTGEVVAEGEATLRLPRHVLLRAHLARVTLPKPQRTRETRVVIEPMPNTVAER